ncbi:MAG: MmgE/PrpD family protein, partial [Acetobacteraceae bacterium]|nr:MmgE/PrpD family protein [Acetobacteraceae bacterium]
SRWLRATRSRSGRVSPATNGTFGTAAAASRALGLDAAQTAAALGFAGTQAAGLNAFFETGDDTKSLHPGKAGMNGVLAARRAALGATSPPDFFGHPKGYLAAYSMEPNPDRFRDPLIRRLLSCTEVEADEALTRLYPEKFPARLVVTMQAGAVFQNELMFPKGDPQSPLTDAELADKFRDNARDFLAPDEMEQLIENAIDPDRVTSCKHQVAEEALTMASQRREALAMTGSDRVR